MSRHHRVLWLEEASMEENILFRSLFATLDSLDTQLRLNVESTKCSTRDKKNYFRNIGQFHKLF